MTVATVEPVTLPVRTEPWPHQIDAFEFARDRRGSMLEIGMGGGKGLCAVALAEHLEARRVLVLCPKSVVGVWPGQFADHATRHWRVWNGHVQGARGPMRNPSVARRAVAVIDATKASLIDRRPLAIVVNYESCTQGDMAKILLGTDWDLVICDESHRIKAPGGKQSRYVAQLAGKVRAQGGRLLELTGTSCPHSELDLYAQLRALDPTVLGTSYAAFKARYGAPKVKYRHADGTPVYLTTPGGQVIYEGVREDRRDELLDRVSRVIFRVPQEQLDEQLGLLEPVDVHRTCELEPATRKVYAQLERDGIAQVADGVVTAANAMVLVLRLAQATSGFAKDADTDEIRPLIDGLPEKARLLADVLEDLDRREPVVVVARFHHDLDAIRAVAEKTGRRYGELSGHRTDGLTSDSKMSPDVDVLGVQIQAGAEGVDFTRARYCIYYTVGHALGQYLQSRKRVHRPGQQRRVTYIHLVAEDTVDEDIYGALRRREDVVKAFLSHLNQKGRKP